MPSTIIPTYIKQENQELYHEQINQFLQNNVSANGFVIPSLTQAEIIRAAAFMPNGTMWYCTDYSPSPPTITPVFVGLVNGSLVQFTVTSFP